MKKNEKSEAGSALEGSHEAEILGRLAERVERAVATIGELRRERETLKARVDELSGELKTRDEALQSHQTEASRLSTVEDEYERFKEEREVIRERIESMLQNLESLEESR